MTAELRTTAAEAGAQTRPRGGQLSLYAAGSLGMGLWVTVPGLLLLYFLTQILDVPAFLAGLTLLLPKIVDVVVHPLFGSLSDWQARRAGHRRGLLRWGLLLAAVWVALFTVPAGLKGSGAAMWVGGCCVTGNLFFACFQVPYLATPSDLRIDYHERTRVFTYRGVFLTIGLLGAGVAAPAIVASGSRSSYTRMALELAGVLVISSGLGVVGVRRLTEDCGMRLPDRRPHSAVQDVREAWRDRDFRALLLSYLCTGAATHLFLAAVPFYARYVLHKHSFTAVLMGAFLVPAALAGPVWLRVSHQIGKQRGLLLCQLFFLAGSLALLAGGVLPEAMPVVVVVMGTAFAGLQLFAFAMLPDAVAAAEAHGAARAGAYTGVWTATEATGTAVGPYCYSTVLAVGGFVSTSGDAMIVQSHAARSAMLLGFTLLPAAMMTAALIFQRRCRLDVAAAS